jgi:hypothetical protein
VALLHGAAVIDAVSLFESRSPHRLVEWNFFVDGHHPNLAGTAVLADALAAELGRPFGQSPRRRFARAPMARAAIPASPADEAAGLLYGGRWLLAASVDHLQPRQRQAMAEDRFRRAARLDKSDSSAELGLCLVDAARRGADLKAVFGPVDFFGRRFELPPVERAAFASRLRAFGVPGSVADAAIRLRRD